MKEMNPIKSPSVAALFVGLAAFFWWLLCSVFAGFYYGAAVGVLVFLGIPTLFFSLMANFALFRRFRQ